MSATTDEFLSQLDWKAIDKFCQSNDGFYSHQRKNGLLTEFEYVKQRKVESFEIISFQGKV